MVVEAGSPGIQKQAVKSENLKSMEDQYEKTLQELADVIKVASTRVYTESLMDNKAFVLII